MEPTPELKEKYWKAGFLGWKFHLGQIKIDKVYIESEGKTKLFVLDCSRQLGKSVWCATKAIETAIAKPGCRVRYATAFLTDLQDFIIPAFDLVLVDCPTTIRPQYLSHKTTFIFPNGSRIKLVGLDRKPNGLRGNRLDLAVLDECGYVSRLTYLYRFVLIPATTHVPEARIIMASTQPETPDHDFVKFCDRAAMAEAYVKLDIENNPLLTKTMKEDIAIEYSPNDAQLSRDEKILLGKKTTAYRREYLCERIVEEGRAIIPEFREDIHVKESPKSPAFKFWKRIESLDSGVRDQTACLFAYFDFERAKTCIEAEFAIHGADVTTRRINELVRATEKELEHYDDRELQKKTRRVADNDNLILLQDLGTEYGLNFAPTSKDDLAAMVNKVRLWFQAGRIEIHPRCKRLIAALKAGIWNDRRDAFSRSDIHGHFDLIASLVYLVRNCPEHENPLPDFWSQDLSNVVYPQRKKQGNVEELRRGFRKSF